MTRRSKFLLMAVIAILVVAAAVPEVYRLCAERVLIRAQDEARNAAMASASPSTPEEARAWLESHGYRVVFWNPHDPRGFVGAGYNGMDVKHHLVMGQRQIRQGGWMADPAWVNVSFHFALDGTFQDVQASLSPWAMGK